MHAHDPAVLPFPGSLAASIAGVLGAAQPDHPHPLYYFSASTKPGQVNGQGVTGFGAHWDAVSARERRPTDNRRHECKPTAHAGPREAVRIMARPLAFVLPLGVDSFAVDDGAAEPQCGWRRFVATTKATSSSGLGDILRSRARPGRPLEDGVLAVVVAGAVDGEAQVMAEPA